MATGAGECGCGQGAACVCSQPAASLKRTFSQLDGNVALPSLRAVFPNLGDGQRNQAAGVAKPAGGLSARLLNRVQSQPAASNQSGGSSGGHPAVAVAAAAAAAPHLNAGVAAPVAVTTGVGAVRQGAPGLRPSTFLDVISAPPPPGGPSAAGDVAALQSVLPLFMQRILGTNFVPNSQRTDGTAPGGGRSQEPLPGSQAQSAHAPPQQQQAGPAPPRALGAMPSLDFSLKTVARFSSPHSFEWAAFQGAEAQAAGLGAFLGGEAEVHTGEQNQTALLARALTSCVFPDAQWPTDMCMALARLDGGRELTQRRSRWCAALCSLYGQLRTCRCDYFYILHPDGFTALFAAPGVRMDGALPGGGGCAWVTPTTRGFRQRMRRYGVDFTSPLAPDADAGASDALEEELAEFERHNPGSTRGLYAPSRLGATNAGGAGGGMVDGTPRSVCVCAGTAAVHALFNFLHGYTSPDAAKDVPVLLAPVPFFGCAIMQLGLVVGTTTRDVAADVTQLGSQRPAASQPAAATGASTRVLVHTATVTCPGSMPGIAPWHLARLLALFRDTQQGAFSSRLETAPSTAAFNLAASQPAAVATETPDEFGAAVTCTVPRGAYGTAQERDAARGSQALGWPDSVCDALHCVDGQFTVPDALGPAQHRAAR